MSVISIGPFMINGQLLTLVLAMFIAHRALKIRLVRFEHGKLVSESFGNALVIAFIVWKLSIIIFDPMMAIRYPLTILYFDGGSTGWVMAIFICVIYLSFRAKKHKTSLLLHVEGMMIGWLAGSAAYRLSTSLLTLSSGQFTMSLAAALHFMLAMFVLIWLIRQKPTIQPLHVWLDRLIGYGLAFIVIEYVNVDRIAVIARFTIAQVVHFFIVITAFITKIFTAKT